MGNILQCHNLSFTYQSRSVPSLVDIDLDIEEGDFLLCTGPTGCGKSTLLKAFNGLIPHETGGRLSGEIVVAGKNSIHFPVVELSQTVGLMFQNPDDQIFSTTVADEVGFALGNIGMKPDAITERVRETLEWVGLPGKENGSVHALSGGERQRLALAAVLALRPKVLALDEPISQLDPKGAVDLLRVLELLNRDHGITLIVVEHRLHEVMPVCRNMIVMEEGRILWRGSRQAAFRNPDLFLRMGLRIPQAVHICHNLGLALASAAVEDAVDTIRQAYELSCRTSTINKPLMTEDIPGSAGIEIKNLEFRYERTGQPVLRDVSLSVPRGQFVALMGNNGAGKSTLLQHICGLLQPDAGKVSVLGQEVRSIARTVGMVMQNPDLMLFNTTVIKEIMFGKKQGLGGKTDEDIQTLIKRLGLDGLEEYFPLALSQGQRVRVAIASLLACEPEIFLLDEPTTGQDLGHIDDIITLLQEYVGKGGTVIFCTHDTEVAARYAQRVVVMTGGRVVADSSPRNVFSDVEMLRSAGLRSPIAWQVSRELYGGSALCVEEVVNDVQQASMGS